MGLDITAYSRVEIVGFADDYDEDLEADDWTAEGYLHQDWINPHFPHAVPADWPREGYVRYVVKGESHGFRAGSYGGYGQWREQLANIFLNITHECHTNGFWEAVHASTGQPFYELINFSDCEGILYGPVCEKLYTDFSVNRQHFIDNVAPDEFNYDVGKYDEWTKAFELAADNGLVSFH